MAAFIEIYPFDAWAANLDDSVRHGALWTCATEAAASGWS